MFSLKIKQLILGLKSKITTKIQLQDAENKKL